VKNEGAPDLGAGATGERDKQRSPYLRSSSNERRDLGMEQTVPGAATGRKIGDTATRSAGCASVTRRVRREVVKY